MKKNIWIWFFGFLVFWFFGLGAGNVLAEVIAAGDSCGTLGGKCVAGTAGTVWGVNCDESKGYESATGTFESDPCTASNLACCKLKTSSTPSGSTTAPSGGTSCEVNANGKTYFGTCAAQASCQKQFATAGLEKNCPKTGEGCCYDESASSSGLTGSGIMIPSNTGLPDPKGAGGPVLAVLTNFLSWSLIIFMILAITSFVITGFQYIFAFGGDIAMAKKNFTYSIIAVATVGSAMVIVKTIDFLLNAKTTYFNSWN